MEQVTQGCSAWLTPASGRGSVSICEQMGLRCLLGRPDGYWDLTCPCAGALWSFSPVISGCDWARVHITLTWTGRGTRD